jgi:hypothetical protein
MARRKQVAVQQAESTRIEEVAPEAAETATTAMEAPREERPSRQWRENPSAIRIINLDGYKIKLQESRPDKEMRKDKANPTFDELWQMQIKFGSGGKEDMPPEQVLDYLRSLTKTVTTKEGEEKDVRLFRWNARDEAWGMAIEYEAARASRIRAEQVFDEVVAMVAKQRGAGRQL